MMQRAQQHVPKSSASTGRAQSQYEVVNRGSSRGVDKNVHMETFVTTAPHMADLHYTYRRC